MSPQLWDAIEQIKSAETEIERLREDRDRIARDLAMLRLKHSQLQMQLEDAQNTLATLQNK
jgi:predicted  nucleic acid-binding Zn-ribbon protein